MKYIELFWNRLHYSIFNCDKKTQTLLSNGKKITWYKNAKQIYRKYGAKEVLRTLSFNYVLLHKKDTKMYQVIF